MNTHIYAHCEHCHRPIRLSRRIVAALVAGGHEVVVWPWCECTRGKV